MSEQEKIIIEIHEVVMSVLKSGSASEAEGKILDGLEELLYEQKCFKEIKGEEHSCKGEEIATLFFKDKSTQAIEKMIGYEITPEDFFGFAEYHFEEEEEEELVAMFTESFRENINQRYFKELKSK